MADEDKDNYKRTVVVKTTKPTSWSERFGKVAGWGWKQLKRNDEDERRKRQRLVA